MKGNNVETLGDSWRRVQSVIAVNRLREDIREGSLNKAIWVEIGNNRCCWFAGSIQLYLGECSRSNGGSVNWGHFGDIDHNLYY